MANDIPDIVIGRLPIYLRELNRLAQVEKKRTTSSQELGRLLGISSAQIRKDLSHFGEFGKQGTGYNVNYLVEQLNQILHLSTEWPVALIGAGFLGNALANYNGFVDRGFKITCIFDKDDEKVGQTMQSLSVQPLSELEETIHAKDIEVANLVVPASAAQQATDRLVEAGVKAILSYAPISLTVPPGVYVSYSDPVVEMQRMTYYLAPNREVQKK